jgi:hypothetical protein
VHCIFTDLFLADVLDKKSHKCCSSCKLADNDKPAEASQANAGNSPRAEKAAKQDRKNATSAAKIGKSEKPPTQIVNPNRARELEEALLLTCRPPSSTTTTSTSSASSATKQQQAQVLLELCDHYLALSTQQEAQVARHEYFLRAVHIANSMGRRSVMF